MGRTIFLSTTTEELREHRRAVYEALMDLTGWHCVRIEDFSDAHLRQYDRCREKIQSCDLFVGIIGHCYGKVPLGLKRSLGESEYHWADNAGKERLIFVAYDDFLMPADVREPDDQWQRQQLFRSWVRARNPTCKYFDSPSDLADKVMTSVRNWEQEQQERDASRNLVGISTGNTRLILKLNEATLEIDLTYNRQMPIQLTASPEERIQAIVNQIVTALLVQESYQPAMLTKSLERSLPMDPQSVAPFVPIIVEATKFVFSEVSKWIDDIRKKAQEETPMQASPLALPITEAQFLETQANLQAMAAMMDSSVAQASAFVIRGLVEQIQEHRKHISRLEGRKAKLGVALAPVGLDSQIEDEAKQIVEKTARLIGLLEQVYRKDA